MYGAYTKEAHKPPFWRTTVISYALLVCALLLNIRTQMHRKLYYCHDSEVYDGISGGYLQFFLKEETLAPNSFQEE